MITKNTNMFFFFFVRHRNKGLKFDVEAQYNIYVYTLCTIRSCSTRGRGAKYVRIFSFSHFLSFFFFFLFFLYPV